MAKTLHLRCPHCRRVGAHPVTATDSSPYHWSEEEKPFFERIAGQDLYYHKRTRVCSRCRTAFDTVEMSDHFLSALKTELGRLRREIGDLQGQVKGLDAEVSKAKLNHLLCQMASEFASRPPARESEVSGRAGESFAHHARSSRRVGPAFRPDDPRLALDLAALKCSVRATNCLESEGIVTVGDLVTRTDEELLEVRNFGETTLAEVKGKLAWIGLTLGMRPLAVVLTQSISELCLSVRSRKAMTRLGIATLRDLVCRTGDDLLESRNFGQTALQEVTERLALYNLTLGMALPE